MLFYFYLYKLYIYLNVLGPLIFLILKYNVRNINIKRVIYYFFIISFIITLILNIGLTSDYKSYDTLRIMNITSEIPFFESSLNYLNLPLLILLHGIFGIVITIFFINENRKFWLKKIVAVGSKEWKESTIENFLYGFIKDSDNRFLGLIIVLHWILFILFTTTNLLQFYITFEGSMIPLYYLILFYGKRKKKINAAYYLFFYTFLGSLSFLIGLIYFHITYGTVSLQTLSFFTKPLIQIILFPLFFIPLAVKLPVLPFHIWLPEAHVEASTEGSVLLAAIMLKIGSYGILKILFRLLPLGCLYFKPIVQIIGLISVILISFSLFRLLDLKKIIAYSSIIHMNLVLLAFFSFHLEGIEGGYSLMIFHGWVSSALFICIGFLYNKFHTRSLYYYSGLSSIMPKFSFLFFLLILSNCSFPFTGPFIGEMLIFLSLFKDSIFVASLTLIASFLIVISSLLTFLRICGGILNPLLFLQKRKSDLGIPKNNSEFQPLFDLNKIEFELLLSISLFLFLSTLFPKIFLNLSILPLNFILTLL